MGKQKLVEITITLKDASLHAHEKNHYEYILEKLYIEHKVRVLDKQALTFHPGVIRYKGEDLMAVRIECRLGQHAFRE